MSKREIKLYVSDIKECIGKIERYTKDMSFDEFVKDEKHSMRLLEILR